MTLHFIPMAPPVPLALDNAEARAIACDWISPAQRGLVAFATGARLDDETLVMAVRDVRVEMAECPDPDLALLLIHLQDRCKTRGLSHRPEDVWCWCEPYQARSTAALSDAG